MTWPVPRQARQSSERIGGSVAAGIGGERSGCGLRSSAPVSAPATQEGNPTERSDRARSSGIASGIGPLLVLCLITAGAAVLRLSSLRLVAPDPFYDAAVRSMSQSLHNFFFGAYEPGGSVSIDKPPIDLWLQVVSVKLFGFGPVALKLPQAIAGTLAAPLLYDAVRRVFGVLAGLASALVLAVLPIAVLTARSDTMDSVMMLLSVLALWLLVRFVGDRRARWLYLAAVAMGLAFNVKLFQGLVGLPALALLAWLAGPTRRSRRLVLAGGVFVAVSLSWLTATLIVPNAPYAIGSTNGSAWNAAFVFNGYDRIADPATQPSLNSPDSTGPSKPLGNSEEQRADVPIGTPSVLRLFAHDGPLSGLRLGFVLLSALALGVPALIASVRVAEERVGVARAREQRVVAVALLVWLGTGVVLFSGMARLHPRYTDGFTPAVAAAAGIGLAWIARASVEAGTRAALAARITAAAAAVALVLYGRYLLDDASTIWRVTALAGAAALVAAAVPLPASRAWLMRSRGLAIAGALAAAGLLIPVSIARGLVIHHEDDAGHVGAMAPAETASLSAYLKAHRDGAHYELATAAATQAGALIAHDGQPVLVLTSYNARPLVPVSRLAELVAEGAVRYALLEGGCGPRTSRELAQCSTDAFWVRAHGRDVSKAAGLSRSKLLWRLRSR
jgi:4-amino-4-deoxy-L-arabinose transferase-like glycosyltransferase